MCHQPRHHFPGSKGCAIVEYRTAAEARRAIRSMTDTELRGRLLGLGVGMG
jgi:RNA recognition motif-containing protein